MTDPLKHIKEKWGSPDCKVTPVSGGSINLTFKVSSGRQHWFCKINSQSEFPHLFKKEAQGLTLIASSHQILTPAGVQAFDIGDKQFLVMDWIEEGNRNEVFWTAFGEELAKLHQVHADQFGLDDDNYMGSVPQINSRTASWKTFFTKQRLQYMVKRNREKGLLNAGHVTQFEKLYTKSDDLFGNVHASLLHGDLWSGNFLCNKDSKPVLIDPAVYYGYSLVDIAMTRLFGGFHQHFYQSYNYHSPLPENWEQQCEVLNLYPLLIHLELFGSSYLGKIETVLNKYC
jgi:protein-ribulosamine 3-kinase